MNYELTRVQDWVGLARKARYKVKALVVLCRVSKRSVERHFKRCGRMTAEAWLREVALCDAASFLTLGQAVKEAAQNAGFNDLQYFYRQFKRRYGCPPGRFLQINDPRVSERTCGVRPPVREEGEQDSSALEIDLARSLQILNVVPQRRPEIKTHLLTDHANVANRQ